jgi:hypothetical protein
VRAKTPLAEVFYFLPGNGARKTADGVLTSENIVDVGASSSSSPRQWRQKNSLMVLVRDE